MKKAFCSKCEIQLINDEVALSLRLLGKGTSNLLCLACLSNRIGCSVEDLTNKANALKKVGCEFFARVYVD